MVVYLLLALTNSFPQSYYEAPVAASRQMMMAAPQQQMVMVPAPPQQMMMVQAPQQQMVMMAAPQVLTVPVGAEFLCVFFIFLFVPLILSCIRVGLRLRAAHSFFARCAASPVAVQQYLNPKPCCGTVPKP